jgi:hypothetical protein
VTVQPHPARLPAAFGTVSSAFPATPLDELAPPSAAEAEASEVPAAIAPDAPAEVPVVPEAVAPDGPAEEPDVPAEAAPDVLEAWASDALPAASTGVAAPSPAATSPPPELAPPADPSSVSPVDTVMSERPKRGKSNVTLTAPAVTVAVSSGLKREGTMAACSAASCAAVGVAGLPCETHTV